MCVAQSDLSLLKEACAAFLMEPQTMHLRALSPELCRCPECHSTAKSSVPGRCAERRQSWWASATRPPSKRACRQLW